MFNTNKISMRKAFEEDLAPLDYVLPNLPVGSLAAIVSPNTGSMDLLAIAVGVAGGPDLLDLGDIKSGKVKYLSAGVNESEMIRRIQRLKPYFNEDIFEIVEENLEIHDMHGKDISPSWHEQLTNMVNGSRLLIIDGVIDLHYEAGQSSASDDLIKNLEIIAQITGCTIIFSHEPQGVTPSKYEDDDSVIVDGYRVRYGMRDITGRPPFMTNELKIPNHPG